MFIRSLSLDTLQIVKVFNSIFAFSIHPFPLADKIICYEALFFDISGSPDAAIAV